MQVYAKTDESDVGTHQGRSAGDVQGRRLPEGDFHGIVSQIRMNPTTVQNVVTYDAIIDFANPELKLFPGMTAYVDRCRSRRVQNVVKVPNAALRYRPPMSSRNASRLYARYGIDGDGASH